MENGDVELGSVGETVQSILYLSKRMHNGKNQDSPSISRVSDTLRNLSASSFNPQVVTIGPLHPLSFQYYQHEEKKNSYLINLMNRIPSSDEEIMKQCVQKVYASLEQIRACYDTDRLSEREQARWRYDDSCATMIVMDACFILEFVNQISEYDKSFRGNMLPDQTIVYDLVLLENQIPFFILDEIFQCTILKFKPDTSLVEFMCPLLNLLNIFKADIKSENISISTTDHILSLLYECYKPQQDITSGFLTSTIHSAVDLDRAGVNLKPNRNPKWMMGIDVKLHRFPCCSWCCGKPTLRMPVLYVHDYTELVLRNLIAYEHHSRQTRKYITSYAYAMDMLVNTQEDVTMLIESRVLVSNMGSNEQAVNMINNLCKQVAREHFFYEKEWQNLDEYCNGYWPKNIVWLKRTYFNSPWNIIALFAGIILFALTVVQTFYTIKAT